MGGLRPKRRGAGAVRTDHHARAVVDEERRADGGPRVDVDGGAEVAVLADHPRDEGHLQAEQLVGDPVGEDGLDAWGSRA